MIHNKNRRKTTPQARSKNVAGGKPRRLSIVRQQRNASQADKQNGQGFVFGPERKTGSAEQAEPEKK